MKQMKFRWARVFGALAMAAALSGCYVGPVGPGHPPGRGWCFWHPGSPYCH